MSFKCQARDLEAFWQIGTCGTNLLQVLLMLINIHFVGGRGFQVLRQRVLFEEGRSISMAKIMVSSVSGVLF